MRGVVFIAAPSAALSTDYSSIIEDLSAKAALTALKTSFFCARLATQKRTEVKSSNLEGLKTSMTIHRMHSRRNLP